MVTHAISTNTGKTHEPLVNMYAVSWQNKHLIKNTHGGWCTVFRGSIYLWSGVTGQRSM